MSNRTMPTPPSHKEKEQEPKQENVVEERAKSSNDPEVKGNEKKVTPVSGGLQVVAIQDGFFRNSRKKVGAKFNVPSEEYLGSWMKCVDPAAQKAHEERMKAKREQLRIKAEQEKPAK